MKYLYGASVQGIQDFIFKTNKLQEIVGASEIVKSVAGEFEKISGYKEGDKNILINAAGNIKAIFGSREECQKVVLEFGKIIQQKAHGITLSQAVIEIGDNYTQNDIDELEKNLKTQRNKPSILLDMSINIMKLNPKTAKPAIKEDKENIVDKATEQKLQANQEFYKQNPSVKEYKNFSYLKNTKGKLAVIHIDGNGLGKIIKALGEKLSTFSIALDRATHRAVENSKSDSMHIREVIIGGDDVTVISNANDALEFTKNFLQNFEDETSKIEELQGISDKLTACAGIAYCNEKYPFHYAVDLAETLCGVAKNHSERKSSSLMFHNIQSSNFQSWDIFVEDELTIRNDKEVIRCDFGPYYLNEPNQPLISDFLHTVGAYASDGSPISRLRAWLGELGKSDQYAKDMLKRINKMAQQSSDWNSCIMEKNLKNLDRELSNETLIIGEKGKRKTPIYDVLQILSVTEAKK